MQKENINKPQNLRYHDKRIAITKEFKFDAAHKLYEYEGNCKNLHGHTYKVKITLSGITNAQGIVIDFSTLKNIFNEAVKKYLDHQYLNEALPNMNTSVENMIVWIWEQLEDNLKSNDLDKRSIRLEEITLFETPTSSATLKRDWMIDNNA